MLFLWLSLWFWSKMDAISSPLFTSMMMFWPAMLFLWLSLWFWSKMDAISSPFLRMDRRAFLLSCGASEDTGVCVKTSTNIAVGALEGEVLLAAAIVGLGSVGVEIYTKGLS